MACLRRLSSGLPALCCAIVLGGCDASFSVGNVSAGEFSAENLSIGSGGSNRAADSPIPPRPLRRNIDPALVPELRDAAQRANMRVPVRVDAITTLTAVHSDGPEIIYEMSLDTSNPTDRIVALRQRAQAANQTNICNDSVAGTLIRRGASINHRYTDAAGNRFETRIVSCPPQGGGESRQAP